MSRPSSGGGRAFSLKPFPGGGPSGGFRVTGEAARSGETLSVRYGLEGDLETLAIPSPAAAPARRDGLWEETCFELFLAGADSPGYREFNLSPAGHWNVYRFSAYREGMAEEAAFAALPFRFDRGAEALSLHMEIDLSRIFRAGEALSAGVSAVLRRKEGGVSCWALAHPGPRPDFHVREGFLLAL